MLAVIRHAALLPVDMTSVVWAPVSGFAPVTLHPTPDMKKTLRSCLSSLHIQGTLKFVEVYKPSTCILKPIKLTNVNKGKLIRNSTMAREGCSPQRNKLGAGKPLTTQVEADYYNDTSSSF